MKRMKKEQKGITLVALVVTIIILLILAGVAIATVTGDNGLFRKAREAVNTYKDSEANESQSLDYIAGQLGDLAKYDYNGYARSTMEMTVSDGTYYLPEGFKLASDSGKTINEGIVVEDKNGNEWVWIPCYVDEGKGADAANAIKYDRYDFRGYGNDGMDEETNSLKIFNWNKSLYCVEALPEEEKESVKKYGGYYIGRYEAGDKEYSKAKKMRTNGNAGDTTHTVTIKKSQVPYNFITYRDCITLCNKIANQNGYRSTFTKLTSSYAWDTALKFIISQEEYKEYHTNSIQGNYADREFNYTDIEGNTKLKKKGEQDEGELIPTGQTIPVCNIYDMGGNLGEFVTGETSSEKQKVVGKSGAYHDTVSYFSAGDIGRSAGAATEDRGFRPSMFIK